jgi:hypothetical protein
MPTKYQVPMKNVLEDECVEKAKIKIIDIFQWLNE